MGKYAFETRESSLEATGSELRDVRAAPRQDHASRRRVNIGNLRLDTSISSQFYIDPQQYWMRRSVESLPFGFGSLVLQPGDSYNKNWESGET